MFPGPPPSHGAGPGWQAIAAHPEAAGPVLAELLPLLSKLFLDSSGGGARQLAALEVGDAARAATCSPTPRARRR